MPIDTIFSDILRATKTNIMKNKKAAANHYNSTDNYYSFEKKGSYKKVNNSSVVQYANKESKSVENSKIVLPPLLRSTSPKKIIFTFFTN